MSECDGRPPVQVEPSAANRMVTASADVQTDLPKVVDSSCRPICHSCEPQTSIIRVSSPCPKHFGRKTAFLLALASGKRHSEILVSGAGPEVLFESNQRPERVSIPPFHLLQERTYLRHQTRYSLFLVETNHSTLL